jgi:hypothetical protein
MSQSFRGNRVASDENLTIATTENECRVAVIRHEYAALYLTTYNSNNAVPTASLAPLTATV